jgi:hypothetical protein
MNLQTLEVSMSKLPKIPFKAGDDFILTMTVSNKNSPEALAAQTTLVNAQAAYEEEVDKETPDETLLATLLTAFEEAQEAYDEAILVDITEWGITSSLRWITKLISEFTVEKTSPESGIFTISAPPIETQLWKPRIYDVDVQFTIDNKRSSSQTFQIDVKKDVTIQEVDIDDPL